MKNITIHKFEYNNWGSLELEITESKRSFYATPDIERYPFSIKGFGQSLWEYTPFCFFEWQKIQYSFIPDANTSFLAPFELRINNRTLNRSKVRAGVQLLVGNFLFDNQVGETTIEIRDASNKLIFQLCTEVFPQKMNYKSDYKAMMSDIVSIIQNLAFDSLKDTFRKSKARLYGHSTYNEWWGILDGLFDLLIINLGVIKRQPKRDLIISEKVLPIEKIRKCSKKSSDWLRKNSKYSSSTGKGVVVSSGNYYSHALSIQKQVSYNNYENRFVAWAVKSIIEKLKEYKKYIDHESNNKDYSSLVKRISYYQSRLQGVLHNNPFKDVKLFEKKSHFSTSLTRGAGYRDFMYIYLLLSRGLELADNDIFKIELKNISVLYEYWCYLKLVQIIKEQTCNEIDFQDIIKIKSNKFHVALEKGNDSKITFIKKDTNETTTIYFNREYKRERNKVFTYNQKPDYSIEFKKNGFEKSFWYLFDAKYRFDEYPDINNNSYNAPPDAIGQLHRYRDAILHTEPNESTYRSSIKNLGGIILYPYPLSEAEFENNIFYKSIEQVNIGALPFLPSKSSLVSELLNRMINKTLPEEHFEQFIEMDSSEYNQHRNLWKKWVTIGVVGKDFQGERINFLNQNHIYHIPYVNNIHSKLYLSKKILVCIAGSREAFMYDVINWEILSDKELENLGTKWNHRAEKYVAFHLKNPISFNTPSEISPVKFRYATLEGFIRYMKNPDADKNLFYLTNPDAARLYFQLKKENIEFKLEWVDNDLDPSLMKITSNNFIIYSSDKYPDLAFYYNNEFLSLKQINMKIKHQIGLDFSILS